MLVLSIAGLAAQAADPIDMGELEFGKEYDVSQYSFKSVVAHFVAPQTGTVKQKGGEFAVYPDATYSSELNREFVNGAYTNGGDYTFEVEAGKTYYLKAAFVMNTQKLSLNMEGDAALELVSSAPAVGATINLNLDSSVTFVFNQAVKYDDVIISYETAAGAKGSVTPRVNKYGTQLIVNIQNSIKPLVQDGTIAPGSQISIIFSNLAAEKGGNKFNGEDYSKFDFTVSSVGLVTTSEAWPSQFKSFWVPGDADGIIKLTFNGNLKTTGATAEIYYGNVEGTEGLDFYHENLTPVVEGNTITVDLTNHRRSNSDMITGTAYDVVTVKVSGIKDEMGYPVASPGQGTVGSYSRTLTYVDAPRATILCEATPENGGSLQGVTEIEMWISGLNAMTFEGFDLSYEKNGAVVSTVIPMSAVTKKLAAADGNSATFVITVPEEARNCKNYKLSLHNLVTNDGYDHLSDVMVQYDAFVLTSVSPANGSRMEALKDGQVVSVTTNMTEKYPEMYMVYEVRDLNPVDPDDAIVKTEYWLTRQEDGSYTATIPSDIKLMLGHTYRCTFTAWATEMDKNYREDPIGTAYVDWYGATAPYRFSDILFEGITPSPETVLTAEDNVFTLKFDGLVNLPAAENFINTGQGTKMSFQSIEPVEPTFDEVNQCNYSSTWVATIAPSFMASQDASLYLSFKAYDLEGLLVEGNIGKEENSYFQFTYEVAAAYKDFEVYPTGEEPIATLDNLVVYSELGIMPSYSVPFGDAYVMNMAREVVATVKDVIPVIPEGAKPDYDVVECTIELSNPVEDAGTYVMVFPRGMFNLGNQFSTWISAEKQITYTLTGSGLKVTANPAEGQVTSLKTIVVTPNNGVMLTGVNETNPTITREGGEPVEITDIVVPSDDENPWATEFTINLPAEITEPGNYTITIPEHYFYIQGSFQYSQELTLKYEVVTKLANPADNWVISPAQGIVESLETIRIELSDYSEVGLGSGKATISINGGEPKNLPDAEFDWDYWNVMIQPLGDTYTEEGTYVISFPEGYFLNAVGDPIPASTLTYQIKSSGISGIAADENGLYVVYNIAGVKVLETENVADIKTLARGIYVVNGVKAYVK